MIYALNVEKNGVKGTWYSVAESATEAIVRTLALGVNVLDCHFVGKSGTMFERRLQ